MVLRTRPTLLAITSGLLMSGLFACGSDELQGAKAEVSETSIKLDLPPVPDFVMPTANPDGSHPVPEMRLNGASFMDTEVRIQGKVLWIYDCATAIRTPSMSEEEVEKLLKEHPEKCVRPHFIIGEDEGTKVERGVQVVEYPRPLREDELKAFDEQMIADAQAALDLLPAFKVGDEVVVTGMWQQTSPGQFHNSDGLLTYKSMENRSAPAEPEEAPKKKKRRRR